MQCGRPSPIQISSVDEEMADEAWTQDLFCQSEDLLPYDAFSTEGQTKVHNSGHTAASCQTPKTHTLKLKASVCAPRGTAMCTLSMTHGPYRNWAGQWPTRAFKISFWLSRKSSA